MTFGERQKSQIEKERTCNCVIQETLEETKATEEDKERGSKTDRDPASNWVWRSVSEDVSLSTKEAEA